METKGNILVTGGGRGIGKGILQELARGGFSAGFCTRGNPDEFASFIEELTLLSGGKGKYKCYTCDVSIKEDRASLLENFLGDFTTLEGLVNNAGVAPNVRSDLLEMGEESFERVMGINLKGPFFLTQLAANKMISMQGDGKFRAIINVGSVSADFASINRGEYCLSKAGVRMATRLYAARLAEENIPVYEVQPGIIHSDMTKGVTAKYDALIDGGLTLQKRWGEPSDVGRAVRMLLSGDLAYSTGQVIRVDGGLSVERF